MNLLSCKTTAEVLNIEVSAKTGAFSEDQENSLGIILNIYQALRTVVGNSVSFGAAVSNTAANLLTEDHCSAFFYYRA